MLAVLMLSYASTRSVEMQATAAPDYSAVSFCGDVDMATAERLAALSAELALASDGGEHKPSAPPKHVPCLYCAAAAHAPIIGPALEARQPAALGFIAFSPLARAAPQARAEVQPRARGPPSNHLTA